MLTLLLMLTLTSQVRKLILQQIRQEIPEGEALEVQEPEQPLEAEEALEAREAVPQQEELEEVLAAVLPEEEARLLETLEEEVRQAQALQVPEGEELEVQEQAEVLNE